MSKKLKSIFTDEMDACFFTKSVYVDRHHCFGGANRKKSEKYNYVIPIRKDLHPNGVHYKEGAEYHALISALSVADGYNYRNIDEYMKMKCQQNFEENHGTREDFIMEFGRNYL